MLVNLEILDKIIDQSHLNKLKPFAKWVQAMAF